QLVAHAVQRVLGHVEPERLLLQAQQLGPVELARWDHRVMARGARTGILAAEVEERALPEQPVSGMPLRPCDHGVELLEQPFPWLRLGEMVECAAFDQRLERTLV